VGMSVSVCVCVRVCMLYSLSVCVVCVCVRRHGHEQQKGAGGGIVCVVYTVCLTFTPSTVTQVLDCCLLTDAEMVEYEQVVKRGDNALRDHFVKQDTKRV
jgi:hypothetical protein